MSNPTPINARDLTRVKDLRNKIKNHGRQSLTAEEKAEATRLGIRYVPSAPRIQS